jgi:hypothetical protein
VTRSPSTRPAVFVLLVLALSAPTLGNVIGGRDSGVAAGEHFAGAIVVSWVAVSLVSHLVDGYRAALARRHAPERRPRPSQPAGDGG